MKYSLIIGILFILLFSFTLDGQVKDSLSRSDDSTAREQAAKKKLYSGPRKASILSAILPGAGQVYNKKYWKVPIIYTGIGGLGYMFYYNNSEYNSYRSALKRLVSDSSLGTVGGYSLEQLQSQKVYYEKYRNFAAFGLGILYILNIVDANVDAHLKTFDVSDDLSISIDPWQYSFKTETTKGMVNGVSLKFNFK